VSHLPKVTVQVPATSANLGPGFDCLGLALELYNRLSVEIIPKGIEVFVTGEGMAIIPGGEKNLAVQAAKALYRKIGRDLPGLRISMSNDIPLARGLGSSAAAVVGGLVAANQLCDSPLGDEELLNLAFQIEGHPDNVVPALLGGLTVAVVTQQQVIAERVNVPSWPGIVLFVPESSISTSKARAILHGKVSHKDAVFNVGRAALLLNALVARKWENLRVAMDDRLHQPYRTRIFPAMPALFEAAYAGGALGAALSGAGSTIIAFASGNEAAVVEAMREAAAKLGVSGRILVTRVSAVGARLVE